MKLHFITLIIVFFIIQTPILFSQATPSDTTTTITEEVVIEARRSLTFAHSPVIAVFSQSDIKGAPISSLADLLDYLQGVDLRTRGVEGMQADVSIRGGTFDQTVVLLNGINVTDPQTGHHSLNIPLDISAVQRIEVLQGVDTWIAGVPTFCGAINIVTQTPEHAAAKPYISYGMHDFLKGGLTYQHRAGRFSGYANVGYTKSGGYIENTDFKTLNAFALLNYDAAAAGQFELQAGRLDKEFGANSFYSTIYRQQYEYNDAWLTSLKYTGNFGGFGSSDRLGLTATAYYRQHNDIFELFRWEAADWYTGANYHRTDVFGTNASLDYRWRLGTSSLGAALRSEKIKSSNLGDSLSAPIPVPGHSGSFYNNSKLRTYENAYLKHRYTSNKWHLQAGVMLSGNDDYGFRALAGGDIKYFIGGNASLAAVLQQGYRVPTFTDLYYVGPQQQGNVALKPEESTIAELTYRWASGMLSTYSRVFYRYGYRIIDWVYDGATAVWHAENLADVGTIGLDLGIEYDLAGLLGQEFFIDDLRLDYSYLDVTKLSGGSELSLYATDFLRHQLGAGIDMTIWECDCEAAEDKKAVLAALKFRFQSRAGGYPGEDGSYVDFPAAALCDLRVMWQSDWLTVYVDGTNIFDRQYVDIGNIAQPGIWIKAGVSANIHL